MGQAIKKEIRLTFYLDNEDDKDLYRNFENAKQPGRDIKRILKEYFERNDSKNNYSMFSRELIEGINTIANKLDKLDKLDNIKIISQNSLESNIEVEEYEVDNKEGIKEIELTATVSADDVNDIDF